MLGYVIGSMGLCCLGFLSGEGVFVLFTLGGLCLMKVGYGLGDERSLFCRDVFRLGIVGLSLWVVRLCMLVLFDWGRGGKDGLFLLLRRLMCFMFLVFRVKRYIGFFVFFEGL